jgi:hypothetical protein
MAKRQIWSGEARRLLYRRLVEEFGRFEEWKKSNSPGGGRDAAFEGFCKAFATVVGASSPEAVKHQIRFAMPETDRGSVWEQQTQTAIANKAAALEEGFIGDKHLPHLLAVGKGKVTREIKEDIFASKVSP